MTSVSFLSLLRRAVVCASVVASAFVFSALLSLPPAVAEGLLTRTPAVLYDGPATNAKPLIIVSGNQPLRQISKIHGWHKVSTYAGDTGWVAADDLRAGNYSVVLADRAAVFAQPSAESAVVFYAKRGVVVEVLGNNGGWLQVVHQDGEVGYLAPRQVWLNH